MEKKTQIKKIVIEIDGKEIFLSIENAKKLHEVLDELFQKNPQTYFPSPIIIERYRDLPYWHSGPTWGSSLGMQVKNTGSMLTLTVDNDVGIPTVR